jgi:hypothetical protein
LIGLAAIVAGIGLAMDIVPLFLIIAFATWLVTLPYHTEISLRISIATFASALILPFFPGRPFLWELSALLGWSGFFTSVAMQRNTSNLSTEVWRHRWLFIGVAGYVLVLLVTMYYRGFGLRVFGGTQTGGRNYVQQLICAIFPISFLLCPLKEKTLVRLFLVQCGLTITYLISDFAFTIGKGQAASTLLQFFEVPVDAVNFESQVQRLGFRRFQSLALVPQGILLGLMVRFPLRDFFSRRGLLLLPLAACLLVIGLFSGHRWLFMIVTFTAIFCGVSQKFFTTRHVGMLVGLSIIVLSIAYTVADRLPLAGQRALSVLPGIQIEFEARQDAAATLETRRIMFNIGMNLLPQYFWIGRGFHRIEDDYSYLWDPSGLQRQIDQGVFYNGPVGLMVNSGIFGTFFMLLFLFAGTALSWRIIRQLRVTGCDDSFTRMCSVVTGLWNAYTIAFLFLHGDSEWALKTFSLQAGMLMACHVHLSERIKSRALTANAP